MKKLSEIIKNSRRSLSPSKDVLTDEKSRSQDRVRRITFAFLASLIARLIMVLAGFVAIPLMLTHLGEERYGVWLTLNSFIAYLAFADLGLGNGLLNAVSEAYAQDNSILARSYISSAFFMLLGVAISLGLLAALIFPWVPWATIFAAHSEAAASEATPATLVFILVFLLQVPLSIVQRVNLGYQEAYMNGLFQASGSLLGLGTLFLTVALGGNLPWIVLAFSGAPVLAMAANWLNVFQRRRPDVRPAIRFVSSVAVKRLLRLGGLFFGLQIAVAFAFSSDYIVAAQVLGPEAVTQLGVPSQMFAFVLSILSMFYMPLWPAYAESIVRCDYSWIRIWLLRSIKIGLAFVAPFMALMVLFGGNLLSWWIGEEVRASSALLIGLAAWTFLATIGNAISMLLNAANVIRFQLVVSIVMATTSLILKILLAQRYGIEGIVWGTVLAYAIVSLGPSIWYVHSALPKRFKRQLANEGMQDEIC